MVLLSNEYRLPLHMVFSCSSDRWSGMTGQRASRHGMKSPKHTMYRPVVFATKTLAARCLVRDTTTTVLRESPSSKRLEGALTHSFSFGLSQSKFLFLWGLPFDKLMASGSIWCFLGRSF